MAQRLGINPADVPLLQKKYFMDYGTTLRGLQTHYEVDISDYLAFVHDVPLSDYIHPDPIQKAVLRSLPQRKYIFTNADAAHARRVLKVLQLEDCFAGIVDVTRLDPYCKPMQPAFQIAMDVAGETDPARCVVIDDLSSTTRVARELGFFSILFQPGSQPDSVANAVLTSWVDLPAILEGSQSG